MTEDKGIRIIDDPVQDLTPESKQRMLDWYNRLYQSRVSERKEGHLKGEICIDEDLGLFIMNGMDQGEKQND